MNGKNINIRISKKMQDNLDWLLEHTGCESQAEVIRQALALYRKYYLETITVPRYTIPPQPPIIIDGQPNYSPPQPYVHPPQTWCGSIETSDMHDEEDSDGLLQPSP